MWLSPRKRAEFLPEQFERFPQEFKRTSELRSCLSVLIRLESSVPVIVRPVPVFRSSVTMFIKTCIRVLVLSAAVWAACAGAFHVFVKE